MYPKVWLSKNIIRINFFLFTAKKGWSDIKTFQFIYGKGGLHKSRWLIRIKFTGRSGRGFLKFCKTIRLSFSLPKMSRERLILMSRKDEKGQNHKFSGPSFILFMCNYITIHISIQILKRQFPKDPQNSKRIKFSQIETA